MRRSISQIPTYLADLLIKQSSKRRKIFSCTFPIVVAVVAGVAGIVADVAGDVVVASEIVALI